MHHFIKLCAEYTIRVVVKMKVIVVMCFAFVVATTYSQEYEVAEDEVGEQFFLVPVKRIRR